MKKPLLNSVVINNFDSKYLLKNNPKLGIKANREISIFDEDNQFLYLYPLNILDYYNAAKNSKMLRLTISDFSTQDISHINGFIEKYFKNNGLEKKLIEIEVKILKEVSEFNSFIKNLYENSILISLKIKNINSIDLSKIDVQYISTFRFSFSNSYDILNNEKKLKYLSQNIDVQQCLIGKFYIDTKSYDLYEESIKILKKYNFDHVLFTKTLIPLSLEKNEPMPYKIALTLKEIEKKYSNSVFKIKVVGNLSELYYDRFKIENENSKKCFVSNISRFYKNGKFFPCSSSQIINQNVCYTDNDYNKIYDYINYSCSDCAYLFENDYIDKLLKEKNNEFVFVKAKEVEINSLGIGTFKLSDENFIKTSILMGQNFIDCNLAYKKGKIFQKVASILKNENRKSIFIYAKLYKKINNISDITSQIQEYLDLLDTDYIDAISIHSLDVVGELSLKEIYLYLNRLYQKGIIKNLGISNVSLEQLQNLIEEKIPLEYFEGPYNLHCRYYENIGLLDYCYKHNITYIAYQPLFMGNVEIYNSNQIIHNIVQKYHKTLSQILLNYLIMHKKIMVFVKSENNQHIVENNSFRFYISDKDYELLDNFNKDILYDVEFVPNSNKPIYTLSYKVLDEIKKV